MKIELGRVVATRGVLEQVPGVEIYAAVTRHSFGDWGIVCEEDRLQNDRAARNGERILSVYRSSEGVKFWVITEWDRSCTTVLLPEEY